MSNEYMLIPYHLRETLSDILRGYGVWKRDIAEIIENAPLHTAHDGEAIYQVRADIGMAFQDCDEFIYHTRDDRPHLQRIVYTAPPRLVDVELLKMLVRIRDDKTWRTNDNSLWPDLLALIRKHESALEQ